VVERGCRCFDPDCSKSDAVLCLWPMQNRRSYCRNPPLVDCSVLLRLWPLDQGALGSKRCLGSVSERLLTGVVSSSRRVTASAVRCRRVGLRFG
jgi:hypothetical protein